MAVVSTGQGIRTSCCSHSALGIPRQHHVTGESKDIKRAAGKVLQAGSAALG